MQIVNEVQATNYTQSIPIDHLTTLVRVGALVHIQTSVHSNWVQRFFVPAQDKRPYRVQDHRLNKTPIDPALLEQVK